MDYSSTSEIKGVPSPVSTKGSPASKGKCKGAAPKPPPGKGKGERIAPKIVPGVSYKMSVGQSLEAVKLKPTQTLVKCDGIVSRQTRGKDGFDSEVVSKDGDLAQSVMIKMPRMEKGVASEDAEAALRNGGHQRPFGIFDANQALVREGFAEVAHTSVVEYEDENIVRSLAALIQNQKEQGRTRLGRITIPESWTDEALRYLRRVRYPDEGDVKLVALNYANCSFPGGNYSDGGMVRAQEEELCRQFPALFESLKSCREAGAKDGRSMCEYANHVFGARLGEGYRVARNVLFTEEIQCLRAPANMSYRLYQCEANKVKAGFVSAAAPIFDRGGDAFFEQWRAEPEEWYEKVFLNVFWAPKSIDHKYDVIVVGPWGCGAFGNDPQTVAQSFLNVIQKHRLLELYKEIHFCMGRSLGADITVGGACNYNVAVFRQVLGALGTDSVEDYTKDLQSKVVQWLDDEM